MTSEKVWYYSRFTDAEIDAMEKQAARLEKTSHVNDNGEKVDWMLVIMKTEYNNVPAGWFNYWEGLEE